jgi:hypothetical protein
MTKNRFLCLLGVLASAPIVRQAYRDPLPPDPWDEVLRADLRFVVGAHKSVDLASKVVAGFEKDMDVPPDA